MSARSLSPSTFVAKAAEIASYYGFSPVRNIETRLAELGEHPLHTGPWPNKRPGSARTFEEIATVCVSCMSREKRGPLLCFSLHGAPEGNPYSPRDFAEFSLQLIGASSSLGDIFVLKTVLTILQEVGVRAKEIRLNSVGDRESQGRYAKELALYVRKRLGAIPVACKQGVLENPLSLLSCQDATCKGLAAEAPRSLSFLSEGSREHLREVLERLDRIELPYRIDDSLTNDARASRVLFSLDFEEHPLVEAVRGGRYDEYLRRITGRKEGMGVRAGILFRKRGLERRDPQIKVSRPARIYFVQLGPEAKFKGLEVLEVLRRAHIPIYQSFESDKLSPQLEEATRLHVPYLMIMGHKEALENAVIVRNVGNRMQHIVHIGELPVFLKRQVA